MADILTSKIQVPSLPNDTLILKDAEARQDLSTALATVTGNPLNFSTRSAQKANETVISLSPIQDLHGYDNPWVGGAGKNKLPMTVDGIKAENTNTAVGTWTGNSYSSYGVIFTILTDNDNNVIGIDVNGTAQEVTILWLGSFDYVAGTYYTLNSGLTTPQDMNTFFRITGYGKNVYTINEISRGENVSLHLEESGVLWGNIRVNKNNVVDHFVFRPYVFLDSNPMTSFAPYSNICPIDGRTETSLVGTNGKESTDPDYVVSNNLTIQFGEKVYGAKVELEKGTVTVDIVVESFTSATLYGNYGVDNKPLYYVDMQNYINRHAVVTDTSYFSSNYFKNSDVGTVAELKNGCIRTEAGTDAGAKRIYFRWDDLDLSDINTKFASDPLQVGGQLATPRIINITPNEISLLKGVNNISTDGDSITLTYRDGKVATLGDLESLAKKISDCDDVQITSLQDGDVLAWDATVGKWKNQTIIAMEVYDTTERVVGTWFGETLYEITIMLPSTISLTSGSWTDIYDASILNISKLIRLTPYATPDGWPFGLYLSEVTSASHIRIVCLQNWVIQGFTIRYTKTSS